MLCEAILFIGFENLAVLQVVVSVSDFGQELFNPRIFEEPGIWVLNIWIHGFDVVIR